MALSIHSDTSVKHNTFHWNAENIFHSLLYFVF